MKLKRNRRSIEYWRKHYAQYTKGSLTIQQYVVKYDLVYRTFSDYVYKFRREDNNKFQNSFAKIKIIDEQSSNIKVEPNTISEDRAEDRISSEIQLETPNQYKVSFGKGATLSDIKAVCEVVKCF